MGLSAFRRSFRIRSNLIYTITSSTLILDLTPHWEGRYTAAHSSGLVRYSARPVRVWEAAIAAAVLSPWPAAYLALRLSAPALCYGPMPRITVRRGAFDPGPRASLDDLCDRPARLRAPPTAVSDAARSSRPERYCFA